MKPEEIESGMVFKTKSGYTLMVGEDLSRTSGKEYCFVDMQDGQVFYHGKPIEQIARRLNDYNAVLKEGQRVPCL